MCIKCQPCGGFPLLPICKSKNGLTATQSLKSAPLQHSFWKEGDSCRFFWMAWWLHVNLHLTCLGFWKGKRECYLYSYHSTSDVYVPLSCTVQNPGSGILPWKNAFIKKKKKNFFTFKIYREESNSETALTRSASRRYLETDCTLCE